METLVTKRLDIRELNEGDAEFIRRLVQQEAWERYIGKSSVRTLEDAQVYIRKGPVASYQEHGFGLALVARRADQEPLGICGLIRRETLDDVDLGFAFLEEHWGCGYATESGQAVMEQASRDFSLTRVVAITSPDNDASIRVLERLGFQFERLLDLNRDGDENGDEVKLFAWQSGAR